MHLSDENIYHLFKHLDVFNEGFLTKYSLLKTFHRSNKDISDEEVEEMLKEMGMDPDSHINFEDFLLFMKNIIENHDKIQVRD